MDGEDGAAAPDRAFWLLSDETRLDILRAVWAADADVLSFSEIRDRVGRPNSGQFNYHLGKLAGHYLTKVDGGYRLSPAGREVVRAVLAGSLTEQPRFDPVPLDGTCADCGGELVVRYDEHGVIECADCTTTVMWNEFPPAGLDGRSPEAFAAAFDRWTQRRFRLAMDGVCPSCAARMSVTVIEPGDDGDDDLSTLHRCDNCRYEARVPLFGHVVQHPAVVSFFHDRGVDITSIPYWELQALSREFDENVINHDPWIAEVVVQFDDARMRLELDADLAVTDVTVE